MQTYQNQSQLYKVLMHPTRLAILDILRDGEQCVCHMETMFGLRQAHISQHLMVLRDAGLVTDRRDGWNIFYRVIRIEIYAVIDAMNAFSGASSTAGDIQPHLADTHPTRKHTCPCPKCNPVTSTSPSQPPPLSKSDNGGGESLPQISEFGGGGRG